ncbi:hypothetical protein D3C74_354650 [compost metagenome]
METLINVNYGLLGLLPKNIRCLINSDNTRRTEGGRVVVCSPDADHHTMLIATLQHHHFKYKIVTPCK